MVSTLNQNSELLSQYYDELTYDMPYGLWLDIINHYKTSQSSVLDIGCGTGELTKSLNFEEVTGLDISETMVNIARSKSPDIEYHVGNMTDFSLGQTFDMATATVDVMNYLSDEAVFVKTLKNIASHLKDGGLFIFDVHSVYKMEQDFMDMTYSEETEHLLYIWNAVYEDEPLTVTHDMTFFIKTQDGWYKRHDESYRQRTYPHDKILSMIKEAGLTTQAAFSDFDINNPITEVCDRNFYIVQKAL
jgi:SAM-dependent methyltransferase